MILKESDIHLKFLLGLPVTVDGLGEFKSPLLRDIVDMTEDNYTIALSSLMFTKDRLENISEEIEELSDFQVLNFIVYHDLNYREAFFEALKLHFNKQPDIHEQGYIYFDELSENTILTEEKFEYIKNLVKIANNLQDSEEEEFVAGNERARKFIEEQKRKKAMLAKYKKPKMNLHSIISAVGWKTKNFDFINELNIYQLYDGYARFQVLDNYHYTMSGIYGGTVDGSKIKLEDINWANILNTK